LCLLGKLAAAGDKVYQFLAHGRWFSPASSTTKTGRHDIAEILLKVALKHKKLIKSKLYILFFCEEKGYRKCTYSTLQMHSMLEQMLCSKT
jgi:hypothetical protein